MSERSYHGATSRFHLNGINTLYNVWTDKSYLDGNQYRTVSRMEREARKEGNDFFNDPLHTFYLRSYGVRHMVKDHSDSERGYSFRLTARVLLYAPSQRQDSTYHGLCYTSRGALAGTYGAGVITER